jgi:DnaJ-domain-containing protein 1
MWDNLEQRIHNLRLRVIEKEAEIAPLREECARLQKELSGFEARYNRFVKPIADQLNAVKKAIEDLKNLQLEQMMGMGKSVDEHWRNPTSKRSRRVETPPLEELQMLDSASKPNEDRDSKLKRLYRSLARRFHPDLAPDEKDRDRRNRVMAQINKAYQEGDMEMLESLDEATPDDKRLVVDEFVPMAVMLMRKLQKEYDGLCEQVVEWQRRRHELKYGYIMELKLQEALIGRSPDNSFLKSIAADLQTKYWEYVKELDELKRSMR